MLKLRRDKPSQAAGMAGGRRGGGDIDDARKVASLLPAAVTPEHSVVQPGNSAGDHRLGHTDDGDLHGRDERDLPDDGRRTASQFEQAEAAAFRILVDAEPWRPHRPRREPSSFPGDFFLVQ
jgi:hypothetical protein